MTREELFVVVGALLFAIGAVRLLLTGDVVTRVIALNVSGAGSLVILGALAYGTDPSEPDPVLHALVLTGIVITVSVTGLALVLLRLAWAHETGPEEPGDG